jgi:hypothetical protein
MDKIYVLQKEYLCTNGGSGITFGKGIEVVKHENIRHYYTFPDGNLIFDGMVENNPEWFKLKEKDKIEVVNITEPDTHDFKDKTVWSHGIWTTKPIPPKKYEPIKKAIEGVLNDKPKTELDFLNIPKYPNKAEVWQRILEEKYTEKELLEAEEKAFNAGRTPPDDYKMPPNVRMKHPTFNDYIQSLKK